MQKIDIPNDLLDAAKAIADQLLVFKYAQPDEIADAVDTETIARGLLAVRETSLLMAARWAEAMPTMQRISDAHVRAVKPQDVAAEIRKKAGEYR